MESELELQQARTKQLEKQLNLAQEEIASATSIAAAATSALRTDMAANSIMESTTAEIPQHGTSAETVAVLRERHALQVIPSTTCQVANAQRMRVGPHA